LVLIKIQPQYLSSGYRCGKGGFRIKLLRLLFMMHKNLSNSGKLICPEPDKSLLYKGSKAFEFLLPL